MKTTTKPAKGTAKKKETTTASPTAPTLPGWEPENHTEELYRGWPWTPPDGFEVLLGVIKHHGHTAYSARSALLGQSDHIGPDRLKHIARQDKVQMINGGVGMVSDFLIEWDGLMAQWADDLANIYNQASTHDEKWGVIVMVAANMRALYDEMAALCRARKLRPLAVPPEPAAPGAPLAAMWGRSWQPPPPLA
jgi:hypothetical protein